MDMREKAKKLESVVFENYGTDKPGFIGMGKDRLFVYLFHKDHVKTVQEMKLPDLGVPIEIKLTGRPVAH